MGKHGHGFSHGHGHHHHHSGGMGMAGMGMGGMGMGGMEMAGLGLGGMNMGIVSGNTFIFRGNQMSFQTKMDSLTDIELQNIVDANITIVGNEIKPPNICCYLSTIMLGSFLIFPLFFMCCDWWWRCANPAFDIQPAIYEKLSKLCFSPQLRNITLNLTDSRFDYPKAKMLYDLLSNSRVIGFTFINSAGGWDYENYQYTNFAASMRPIKQIPTITSDIRWYRQIVL